MYNMNDMKAQDDLNYNRIAEAIDYLVKNFKAQPSLDELAEVVHLSPHHFHRLFTDWAGTSPKKFLQYISLEYSKSLIRESQDTLFRAALDAGLSGPSRLHDLFIHVEGMTPGEYKSGGKNLLINYSFASSPFGKVLIASTGRGVCYLAFIADEETALPRLKAAFAHANFQYAVDSFQQDALRVFTSDWTQLDRIKLHLKGTDFQLKVWETLLKIPVGQLSTYGSIAKQIEKPNASRAVGTAIGSNPVAFLIPCHRVIQSTGVLGGYMWGSTRKTAMVGWEAAKIHSI